MDKEWRCNNRCGQDCCSSVYLSIDPAKKRSFDKEKMILYDSDEIDIDWIKYHPNFSVIRISGNRYMILYRGSGKPTQMRNPFNGRDYLFFRDERCSKLMPSGRCKIYRTRPHTCKVSPCIFDNPVKMIHWFGGYMRGDDGD